MKEMALPVKAYPLLRKSESACEDASYRSRGTSPKTEAYYHPYLLLRIVKTVVRDSVEVEVGVGNQSSMLQANSSHEPRSCFGTRPTRGRTL